MKNIIFAADGTWNGPDRDNIPVPADEITNVYRLFVNLAGTDDPASIRARGEQERRLTDPVLTATIDRMAADTGVEAFARQQAAIGARPDNRPFLAAIKIPTTIIVGADDALTPVKVHEEMHAGIVGSTLHVIADCGHLSTLEAPDAVNALLTAWLAA